MRTVHEWHVATSVNPWKMAQVVQNMASFKPQRNKLAGGGKALPGGEGESDEEAPEYGSDEDASSSEGSDGDPNEGNLEVSQLQERWKEFLTPTVIEAPEPTVPVNPFEGRQRSNSVERKSERERRRRRNYAQARAKAKASLFPNQSEPRRPSSAITNLRAQVDTAKTSLVSQIAAGSVAVTVRMRGGAGGKEAGFFGKDAVTGSRRPAPSTRFIITIYAIIRPHLSLSVGALLPRPLPAIRRFSPGPMRRSSDPRRHR